MVYVARLRMVTDKELGDGGPVITRLLGLETPC